MKFCSALLLMIAVSACTDSKPKTGSGSETKTESSFNPGIDTAAITTPESLLEAAQKLKEAKDKEDLNKDDPSHKKNYYTYLKYKATLSRRSAAITDTMNGNEIAGFLKKYRQIMP